MPLNPEKRAAYAKLDEAVHDLLSAYDSFHERQVTIGYVVVIGGARFASPEFPDDEFEDGDEENMISTYTGFPKLGQQPVVTRGLLGGYEDALRGI